MAKKPKKEKKAKKQKGQSRPRSLAQHPTLLPPGSVVLLTLLLSSPAIWLWAEQQLAIEEVIKRTLLVMIGCWVALTAGRIIFDITTPPRTPPTPDPDQVSLDQPQYPGQSQFPDQPPNPISTEE